jgi:transposase InsO family protein
MKNRLNSMALLRLSVLGSLASRDHLNRGELKKIIKELAQQTYQIPNSKRVHLSEKTIERWYYLWKKTGIDGLNSKIRSDKHSCQLPPDIQEAIIACKKDNPARSIQMIIDFLETTGRVKKGELARSTVHRLLKKHRINKRLIAEVEKIERRAFESQFAGDLWYGDVMHGPSIQTAHGRRKVYLVTVMDDASRLICHSAFCLDETAISIEFILKEALLKRGLPKKLLIDNGPAYRSESLQNVCARLKIRLIYSKPYEPESKGKLERWHLTIRQQLLTELNFQAIHSLDELNARLWVWIEQKYHRTPHSAWLDKKTPLERFQQDLLKIQPLGEITQHLDDYFYHRIKRTIKKDATLSFDGRLFEVPYELVGETLYLVIDAPTNTPKYVESLEHQWLGPVHPLDKRANNERVRQRPQRSSHETHTPKTSLVEELYQKTKKQFDTTT